MKARIGINGFGRIGRIAFRILQDHFPHLEVVGINDISSPDSLAYLLRYDTVHRRWDRKVAAEGECLRVDNQAISVSCCKDPLQIPWKKWGVDYVIESTGHFTTPPDAAKHLEAGARRVIVSAPSKGEMPTYVYGVNHQRYHLTKERVISNASCTTNCLAPMAKVLLESFGIEEGLMTTVHALTASQPSVDGPSGKDWRGGRAAGYNSIPASTGAAKAVALCLPELKGKLTGMAFRVPVMNVSVVDLTVRLSRATSYSEIVAAFKSASEKAFKGIIGFCEEALVSSDFIGSSCSCIFDSLAGIALNERFYKLIGWYDNEWGYSYRLADMLNYMVQCDK